MKITAIRVYQLDLPLVEGRYTWSDGRYVIAPGFDVPGKPLATYS